MALLCNHEYHNWMSGEDNYSKRSPRHLYRLIDEAASSHRPLLISGKRNKAILVCEEDWGTIQETLFLMSVPGMRESISEGMDTPVDKCDEKLEW